MQTTADPIREIVAHLGRSARKPHIEHKVDPEQPGRLFYRIVGDREMVQSAINEFIDKVSGGFGYAVFTNPTRCESGYVAQGAVVLYEAADVA